MNKIDQLPAYLAGAKPFEWGVCDCCTFAADWLVALGKPDPMAGLRGYTTAREALFLLQGDMLQRVEERLGKPMPNPLFAQRGDVAFVTLPNGRLAVGIVVEASVVGPSRQGLTYIPLSDALAAWRT